MKKYKLVKIYPGSPKINSIYEKIVGPCGRESGVMYKNLNKDGACLDSLVIENEPEHWEEIIDKNPLKLEVGKEYILQYVHCKSKPQHVKITRFTKQGYPWQERVRDGGCRGIVSPGCYKLIEEIIEYPIGTKAEDNRINKTFTKEVDGWYTSFKTGHTDKSISNAKHIKVLEEIIDKDYEILSLKCLEDNEIFYNNNNIYKFLFNKLEYYLKNGYIIHSVKRLSDGEVFTVGDVSNIGIINGFHIKHNLLMVISTISQIGNMLKDIDIKKKPIFTTFDNVDIYEGDEYHSILLNCLEYKGLFIAESPNGGKFTNPSSCKTFSTKEAAENFIILNKPCLSLNDIKIASSRPAQYNDFIKTIRKVVKSKL